MTDRDYDFVVCGNGAIGLTTALQITAAVPDAKIALIGPNRQPWSASTAAGAMVAVIAEVESELSDVEGFHGQALELGRESAREWQELLQETKLEGAVTAQDTVVYLQDGASNFERDNFAAVVRTADSLGRLISLDAAECANLFAASKVNLESAVEITGEFAIDPSVVLPRLQEILIELGVDMVDDSVTSVRQELKVQVVTASGRLFEANRTVLAMGAHTASVLPLATTQPMLQGVGTALLAHSPVDDLMPALGRRVIRSVNRGGAQCGVHMVPRVGDRTYIGAGNYVAAPGPPETRFETVRYLLDVAERDLIGRDAAYQLRGDLLLGSRPRSLDGLPLIGALPDMPSVYMATATNRLGLTWAPVIARWVANWIKETAGESAPVQWKPDRDPVPFGSSEHCVSYFVESRVGNALEHRLITPGGTEESALRQELEQVAESIIEKLVDRGAGHGANLPSPDVWGWLLRDARNS